jgi:AraC-like DNA-binding protein
MWVGHSCPTELKVPGLRKPRRVGVPAARMLCVRLYSAHGSHVFRHLISLKSAMLLKDHTLTRLCQARELLKEAGEEQFLITEVAREVEMSPFHFIRQFEALFGLTPHQFRIGLRLDRAKLLLARGQHSVTDVCMEVGFSSLGSFSDLFTRRIGTTPSAYQRRARAMVRVPADFPQELFPGCLSLMGRLPASAFRNFREA